MTRRTPLIASTIASTLLAVSLSGAAQAALIDRGGGLIYDSTLNVTWLKDANYAKTSGYDSKGRMTWANAVTWADNLSYFDAIRNVTYTDWRLPTTTDLGAPGCDWTYGGTECGWNVNPASSEMAHLYHVSLGNLSIFTTTTDYSGAYAGGSNPNSTLDYVGPFINFQPYVYWSGTEYAPDTGFAWAFATLDGSQGAIHRFRSLYALAVRPGDVAAAAVPPRGCRSHRPWFCWGWACWGWRWRVVVGDSALLPARGRPRAVSRRSGNIRALVGTRGRKPPAFL